MDSRELRRKIAEVERGITRASSECDPRAYDYWSAAADRLKKELAVAERQEAETEARRLM
jgi:hypothetical protein